MTFLVVAGDRVMGSWRRGQSVSVQQPQKARRQHMSLGTPAVLMRDVMFWFPTWSTWVSGVPGSFCRRLCWSL